MVIPVALGQAHPTNAINPLGQNKPEGMNSSDIPLAKPNANMNSSDIPLAIPRASMDLAPVWTEEELGPCVRAASSGPYWGL